jgi:predicted Rossmann fold nucleotide-binding protein DprA/Smf involved in DNA uptake
MAAVRLEEPDRALRFEDLTGLGFKNELAGHIMALLEDGDLLEQYLERGTQVGCVPLSRISPSYPMSVRNRLGMDAPGCLWIKGDPELMSMPGVALVGSRDIFPENQRFAAEVGRQAARQGYVLISGNARGADAIAQSSCLREGGMVISIVADSLWKHPVRENVLYISEDGFDLSFHAHRALSRNRLIHCMGLYTFVAQTDLGRGGTWDGTLRNLKAGWSPVFCYQDGSRASQELQQMGAVGICMEELNNFLLLPTVENSFFY